jgi:hypothetical protein
MREWCRVLCFFGALVSCAGVPPAQCPNNPQLSGEPHLGVRVVPRVPTGGTIYAILTISNQTSAPLWFNGRMLAGVAIPGPSIAQELWFDIKRGDQALGFRCQRVARPVSTSDYRLLLPGESFESDQDISACFDVKALGHYTIVAHYQDGQPDLQKAPDKSNALKRELVSSPVRFDVLGAVSAW